MIHVSCKGCGTYDIVGPGHPATVYVPHPDHPDDPEAGQHVLTDRSALRHAHADDCQPGEDGNYPLHFDFMAATGEHGPAVSVTGT
jgi:hypothetical protein